MERHENIRTAVFNSSSFKKYIIWNKKHFLMYFLCLKTRDIVILGNLMYGLGLIYSLWDSETN